MKKYFEYLGLLTFALCSFYYTNKVTKLMNSKDPLMVMLNEYNKENKTICREGYIKEGEVVLGSSGKEVDIEESYSNMQGNEFDKSKLVFNELTCKINLNTVKDNYIIKGNESKDMVSILIKVNNLTLLNDILNVSKNNNIPLGIIVNDNLLSKNKDYLLKVLSNNYLIFEGENISNYVSLSNELNTSKYCIETSKSTTLNECKKEKIPLLRSSIYTKDILLNIKKDLEKGSFYVLSENSITLKELNALIKVINAKGMKVVTLDELFD